MSTDTEGERDVVVRVDDAIGGGPALAAVPRVIDIGAAEREIERRGSHSGRRVSWASGVPFVLPDLDDPRAVAARTQERRSGRLAGVVRRVMLTDLLIAVLVMTGCLVSLGSGPVMALLVLLTGVVWAGTLALLGGYDRRRLGDGPEEFGTVMRAAVVVIAMMGLLGYSLELFLPRRVVLVGVPLTALLTMLARYGWRRWLHRRRSRGQHSARVLVVGEAGAVHGVVGDLRRETHHGLSVVGACLPIHHAGAEALEDTPVLGVVSEVPQVVVDHDIDTVIVVGAQLTGRPLRRLSWALEHTGAELMVAPGLVEVTGPNVTLHPAAGLSLLHVERPSSRSGRLAAKAVLDRVLGTALFLALLPVIGVFALVVRLTSPGPAFYSQQRVGLDGSEFTMWKLRSMVADADRLVPQLADSDEGSGLLFKMRADPRVTPVGRVLRRYSLDELPQLWNVVRGDMSLVGPRPPLPREVAEYHDDVHRRLRVKPGLTGLWQVSGRSDLSWEESIRLDLRYVDNWSPAMDLQILWKTARAVLSGSGAY